MYKRSNFRPNAVGWISETSGYDVRGRPEFSEPSEVGISIIRFELDSSETSIRADKSGSKSRARERVQIGRIQIEPEATFDVGDKMSINGEDWRIESKFPRYDMVGKLHHYQVDLTSWA